ncbi:MAG: thiazole synthase [Chloroflexi bacterium]|nr:MAG: thiazole synthase [Chloroflexota bacterium]
MALTTSAADRLEIGGAVLESRLIHGTGRFPSDAVLRECLEAARPTMITLAIRRLALEGGRNELEAIDLSGYTLLPNTAGATTVDQAVRLARLARAASLSDLIKVEVIGDERTLLPDPAATLEATRRLVDDGFTVLPYCSDDVVLALRLEEAGAAAVMPGAAPIGTTLGIQNPPEMARAFAEAVAAGRRAHLAGRASISLEAVASSPRPGMVGS